MNSGDLIILVETYVKRDGILEPNFLSHQFIPLLSGDRLKQYMGMKIRYGLYSIKPTKLIIKS